MLPKKCNPVNPHRMVGVFVLSNILSYGPTIACSFIQLYNQPMTDTLTNPHDKLFRDTFYELRAARDFLHHYLGMVHFRLNGYQFKVRQNTSE
ncbi:hypothetical protein QUF64_15915 [Anaerolineales bacterium HSG6]|nr:hypothetical protein [Anaerolineales bacterium HSG6]